MSDALGEYLRDVQYGDDRRFLARVQLHRLFSTNPVPWSRWVFDRLELPDDARVLELGCGPGLLWRANADRLPPGWRIVLSDFSEGMVESARRALGERFEYAVVDAQAIPFDDGSFDAVVANHMLYHVPDPRRALAEIRRVLVPAGVLYASTLGRDHLNELHELAHVPNLPPDRFGLENGAAQLEQVFTRVRLHRYDNELRVTDPAPAVAHLESIFGELREARAMSQAIQTEIDRRGWFRVTTSTGLFEARP